MTILVTGNCGYIASHVCDLLAQLDIPAVGLDNLHRGLMSNAKCMTVVGDLRRKSDIESVFEDYSISAVMHFAALTSVPESMEKKDEYFDVNLDGTINLIETMKAHGCNKLIFSSTASIYEQSNEPVRETDPFKPLNNYALTKKMAEDYIRNQDWLQSVIFRYFNVVGFAENYDTSKEFEKTNIVPALLRTLENGDPFYVFGNNYPVKREDAEDKTCVRDYIDVRDLAEAHLLGLKYIDSHKGCKELFNLGTKHGSSVLEFIKAFEKANNVKINYEIKERRKGDPASVVADNKKAKELLGWQPKYTLEESLKVR